MVLVRNIDPVVVSPANGTVLDLDSYIFLLRGSFSNQTINGCQACPIGEYCINGLHIPCEPGHNCTILGLAEPLDCKPGFTCQNPSDPTPCSPGYMNEVYNQTTCIECSRGYYCPNNATVDPTPCQAGTDGRHPGKSICPNCNETMAGYNCTTPLSPEICLNGTYSNYLGTVCKGCNVGYYCINGLRLDCPPNDYYCPYINMTSPLACPPAHRCETDEAIR